MAGSPLKMARETVLRQVRAQPKRAGVLVALGTGVAVMWGRILLFGGAGPAASSAAPAGEVRVESADAPASGAAESAAMRALLAWARSPASAPERKVFAVKLDYFPRDGSRVMASAEEGRDGFWDQLAKSAASRADQEKARRILVENLQAQAQGLDLQSTVMSNGITKALINGTLVEEGDTVGGFRVDKIESKRIVVEREGVKLEVLFNF